MSIGNYTCRGVIELYFKLFEPFFTCFYPNSIIILAHFILKKKEKQCLDVKVNSYQNY